MWWDAAGGTGVATLRGAGTRHSLDLILTGNFRADWQSIESFNFFIQFRCKKVVSAAAVAAIAMLSMTSYWRCVSGDQGAVVRYGVSRATLYTVLESG